MLPIKLTKQFIKGNSELLIMLDENLTDENDVECSSSVN